MTRKGRPDIDRESLHDLLDKILNLGETFDPEICSYPSERHLVKLPLEKLPTKDEAARWALIEFYGVLSIVVKWADAHIKGARYNGFSDIDAHESENTGYEIRAGDAYIGSPHERREHIREKLWYVAGTDYLLQEFIEDLRALEFGEVRGPLKPRRQGKRDTPLTFWEHRLGACEHVNFLYGKGCKKSVARERVANAYGTDKNTIRKWEQRVRTTMDWAESRLQQAIRAGRLDTLWEDKPEFVTTDGEPLDIEVL